MTVSATVSAPTTKPADRDPTSITNPATYARKAPVWIYRGADWRPGIVLASSGIAALVEYRYTGNLARGTDTAMAYDLAARDGYDPYLDPAPATPAAGM